MEYRTLGRTGLKVSVLGMGSGGHDPLGQKSGRSEHDMVELIRRAYDLGINYFDTSPGYLESEVILGKALKSVPWDNVVVSTKIALAGGETFDVEPMKPEAIVKNVDNSLARLGMDHVDIMLVAVVHPKYYDYVMNEQMPVLERLKAQGKIGYIGSSEKTVLDGSHEWLRKALPSERFDVAMAGHNMLNQSAQKTIFPLCEQQGIGVINVFTVRNLFSNPRRLQEVIMDLKSRGRVDRGVVRDEGALDWIMDQSDAGSLVEAAYRYAKYTSPVAVVMCGTIVQEQLEENVRNITKGPLPRHVVDRLAQWFGHLDEVMGN